MTRTINIKIALANANYLLCFSKCRPGVHSLYVHRSDNCGYFKGISQKACLEKAWKWLQKQNPVRHDDEEESCFE